jgi:hypothetical protein
VFVTGGTFTEEARTFLQGIPNPRLSKPFEVEDVRAAVRRALALGASHEHPSATHGGGDTHPGRSS